MNLLREDTKVLALGDIGKAEAPHDTLTTDRGIVTYDSPPEERGRTIVIDFEERSEPRPEHQAVPCCTGAVQASLQQWGRRTLCVACAKVYQQGFRVDCRPDLRRRLQRSRATQLDIWKG